MKTFRARSGPFPRQPYFTRAEIDRICTDELKQAGLYPPTPQPVRIDRFVEKRFGVTPEYDDLHEGVLGYTRFKTDGNEAIEAIVIARKLEEEGGTINERRIRTTLAHESGHALLHARLFTLGPEALRLFDDDSHTESQILCRDVPVRATARTYDGRWWEFQANRAIGGLLMPAQLVDQALKPYLVTGGTLGIPTLSPKTKEQGIRALADIFDVNPFVVRLRLDELYPEDNSGQLSL